MILKSKPTFFELLKQSLQDVEGGYDLLAPKFDQSPYITPEVILIPFFRKLQEEKGAFDTGVDICSGTGAASVHLASLCQRHFTALDLSQEMLNKCSMKLQRLDTSIQIDLIKANALDMPFHNQFDVAVSFGAFGHILKKDEIRFIQQVHKILKPGGCFYFITTSKFPWWSLSLWKQRIFNLIIGIRNLLISPKFIMYYLTFRLPAVKQKLETNGFMVKVSDLPFQTEGNVKSDLTAVKYFKMVKAEKV